MRGVSTLRADQLGGRGHFLRSVVDAVVDGDRQICRGGRGDGDRSGCFAGGLTRVVVDAGDRRIGTRPLKIVSYRQFTAVVIAENPTRCESHLALRTLRTGRGRSDLQ